MHQPSPPDHAVRYFGPYLGGQKVRDALSGLGRVLPLAYAADAAAGTARDLARVRGAAPAHVPRDLDIHGWVDGMLVSAPALTGAPAPRARQSAARALRTRAG